jgi:hypothetical protein
MPGASRDDLENFWTTQALVEGETYILQVTGYLDQQCWEDYERDASAAGDYVLSIECASKPIDEWCADFDWCEDKELAADGDEFCYEWGNLEDGSCRTDADCWAKPGCTADCAATPGCEQPDRVWCEDNVCYTGMIDDRCDDLPYSDFFSDFFRELDDGSLCEDGLRTIACSSVKVEPPDYSSLDLAFQARECYEYKQGPHVRYITEMFLPGTPQECFSDCAARAWSKATIISGDGSLCQCVGGIVEECFLRPAGTAYTIDARAGRKTVCYTRDVDLNGVEYKETCTHEHPCQGFCEAGYWTFNCTDDGHLMQGELCETCGDCDTYDVTEQTGGMYSCEPGTSSPMIAYEDINLDGVVDGVLGFPPCEYWEECDVEDAECEMSSDLVSSPSGTTNHGAGMGWCVGGLNDEPPGGCTASPGGCYLLCLDWMGDDLVAIDWWDEDGRCYCQDDCECMAEIGGTDGYLITRDSAVPALPAVCSGAVDDDGDDDED